MLALFANPGFLVLGAAFVSAPIIIHLINRMRFKKVRWAAMEFLLKAMKRSRRKLIIEQLLLLFLRCLLMFLAALLVCRYLGFSFTEFTAKESLNVVLIDDTLSMTDRDNKTTRTCLDIAKDVYIKEKLVKSLAQSSTNERILLLPLSKVVTDRDYSPDSYERLASTQSKDEIDKALSQIKPTLLRTSLEKGVLVANEIFGDQKGKRHRLHIMTDFRKVDWTGPKSNPLAQAIQDLRSQEIEVYGWDTARPARSKKGGALVAHDNLAITDFRPRTRIVGEGVPVTFTVTVKNFGSTDRSVKVEIYNEVTNTREAEVSPTWTPPMPLKVPANGEVKATFELRKFRQGVKNDDEFFALQLSARLQGEELAELPVGSDSIEPDNIRYATLEIRKKVPVLVIDGEASEGLKPGHSTFHLETALQSVPGASYQVFHGHDYPGCRLDPAKALEVADLQKFPTIFLLNVQKLSYISEEERKANTNDEIEPRQLERLENYVQAGGGVAFFLGPRVDPKHYTSVLYQKGKGVFPVPLDEYVPKENEPPREIKPIPGVRQLLIRDGGIEDRSSFPIFGPIFLDDKQKKFLEDLPIYRYFPVSREWDRDTAKVLELATLPSDARASRGSIQSETLLLTDDLLATTKKDDFKQYRNRIQDYVDQLRLLVEPGRGGKAYELARTLEDMIQDQGGPTKIGQRPRPNLTQFFALAQTNPDVRRVTRQIKKLIAESKYGSPFLVTQQFGKGRVIAMMTTAGKKAFADTKAMKWNDWPGGSQAQFVYQPMIWEMQNYLASQSTDANLHVGDNVLVRIDPKRYIKDEDKAKKSLVLLQTSFRAKTAENPEQPVAPPVQNQKPTIINGNLESGQLLFEIKDISEPGFYISRLVHKDRPDKTLATFAHVYNVDAEKEGDLKRAPDSALQQSAGDKFEILDDSISIDRFANKRTDLSESAVFFLLLMIILITEQALAVHLSYNSFGEEEGEGTLPMAAQTSARAG
ncbi:MAG: BatA domain-containing protein [Gemmataceae bacterium]